MVERHVRRGRRRGSARPRDSLLAHHCRRTLRPAPTEMAEQKSNSDKSGANSAAATSSSQQSQPAPNKEVPSLGALDEDDEFEEFDAQGESYGEARGGGRTAISDIGTSDWDDSETSLAHLTNDKGGATGLSICGERGGTTGGDHLWEDSWDDDDVEDDFSKALRWVKRY